MVSAESVSIRVEPRAPSATETFAIVSRSGASTTLTKSNSPSVAHWWSTFAPSSSTSRLTCSSRSGFDLSVCTPCCVSVERRMKRGIAAGPYSGGLVEVEQRRAEVDQRAQHEQRQEAGDPAGRLGLAVQQRREDARGEGDDDH